MSNNVVDYKASPTCIKFHKSKAFIRGLMGPFGSGKSVACCWEIFIKSKEQTPAADGKRYSRWIVARNTQPQLETTTIKTWLDWFPETVFGKMGRKPPFTHHIQIGDIDLEVIFLALDKPEDQKKLLSFEVTGIWFNEAREIPYELLMAATGRVGRYPPKKLVPPNYKGDWPTWRGIIMDTNPPTDEHWWYKCAEEDMWAVDKNGDRKPIRDVPVDQRWDFFRQPGGLDKEAENLDNLPGGRKYYEQQLGGKSKEWIDVYIKGNYGFIKSGLPVYLSSWNNDYHVSDRSIQRNPSGTIYAGIDASGRHPAAIFLQRTLKGQLQAIHEVVVMEEGGMGAEAFSKFLKQEMSREFPKHDFKIWADPAGFWKQTSDERTYVGILKANGIYCLQSPGLRFVERREAVTSLLERNVQGEPALLVDPSCKHLIRGFNGGYHYRKLRVSGDARYDEKPDKSSQYADIHDSLQYVVCGLGESRRMFGRNRLYGETYIAKSNLT